jgi:hypothetical protein
VASCMLPSSLFPNRSFCVQWIGEMLLSLLSFSRLVSYSCFSPTYNLTKVIFPLLHINALWKSSPSLPMLSHSHFKFAIIWGPTQTLWSPKNVSSNRNMLFWAMHFVLWMCAKRVTLNELLLNCSFIKGR